MLDEDVSDDAARTGDEIYGFLGNAGFKENVDESCGDGRRVGGGLDDDGVAGDKRGHDESGHDGAGEIPRGNNDTYTQGDVDEIVALATHRREFLRFGEAQHFAAV